jgi:hypothetical protein
MDEGGRSMKRKRSTKEQISDATAEHGCKQSLRASSAFGGNGTSSDKFSIAYG